MKRKLSPSAGAVSPAAETAQAPDTSGVRRRRQPQTSCDFCRNKKLKCDRARPCSNCVARRQSCHGGPVVVPGAGAGPVDSADVLERLRRLEQAVFPVKDGSTARDNGSAATERLVAQNLPVKCPLPGLPTPSSVLDLDYPSTGNTTVRPTPLLHCPAGAWFASFSCLVDWRSLAVAICRDANKNFKVSDANGKFSFGLAESTDPSTPKSEIRLERSLSSSVSLPSEEDCLTMFECFLRTTPHCIPRTIHRPSARSTISNFYSKSLHLQSQDHLKVDPVPAAFVLSICASAAFFWDRNATVSRSLFASVDDAARQAKIWLNTAWELLDQLARRPGPGCLEGVQACMVVSDLVYNMEGFSTRFRNLHNLALTASREMSLHLIDVGQTREGTVDTSALTEVKRRVWWHLVSTDWLLSTMGGPLDRTYRTHPRHMMVHLPRNVNDDDLSTVLPADTITDTTYLLLRIRLADVCRQVVDFLPIGGSDVEGLPYEQVLAISQLFSDAMASMPPSFALDAPMQPDAPPSSAVDRQIFHLAFHARLARILRSFLVTPDHPSPGRNTDPRCSSFRSMCLRSARAVLKTGSSLLHRPPEDSRPRLWPVSRTHRNGCVICHMFMACVILATDPKTAPGQEPDPEAEAIRLELANARRLLERVGETSPIAAGLVGRLVGILKRHCVQAAGDHRPPRRENAPEAATASSTADGTIYGAPSGTRALGIPLYAAGGTAVDPIKGVAEQQLQHPSPYLLNPQQAELPQAASWDIDGGAGDFSSQVLDGIEWAALMGGAGSTGADSWGQLFADLDAAFPTPM